MQIKARQYCRSPERGDCFWLPTDYPVLARAYGPADLAPQLAAAGNPAHHPRNARHHG
jgi:L-fuconolactonase